MFFRCNIVLDTSPVSNLCIFIDSFNADDVFEYVSLFYRFRSISITRIFNIPPGVQIIPYKIHQSGGGVRYRQAVLDLSP